MKRIRSMKGLEIYRTNDGQERVGIIYYANGGGGLREMVGAVGEPDPALRADVTAIKYRKRLDAKYKDSRMCVEAVKVLDARRAEVDRAKEQGVPYIPPKEQAAAAELQRIESAKVAEDARTPLLFDPAVKRFMEARTYAGASNVKGYFRNLGKAFSGRYLDTITRAEVAQYYRDRRYNTGPFVGWEHEGGIRPAENDLVQFSALYTFLIDVEERDIKQHPCKGWKARIGKTNEDAYQPEHEAYIPEDDVIAAIYDLATRENMPRFAPGMPTGDPIRTFYKLCRVTAGSPESEPCKVRHGDFTPSNPSLGSITRRKRMATLRYRKGKNEKRSRDLAIPADLEADLLAVMVERPEDPDKLEAWKALPIFRQRDGKKAWTGSSYKKSWAFIVDNLKAKYPGIEDMWTRDWRAAASTKMHGAGLSEPVVRTVMGHALDTSMRYCVVTFEDKERAADVLTLASDRISDRISKATDSTGAVAHAANS